MFRYLVWHAALVGAGAFALVAAPSGPRIAGFGAAGLALLVLAAIASPFGGFIDADGYTPVTKVAIGAIVLGQVAVTVVWWRRANGAPSWVELCVLALLGLSALVAERMRRLIGGEGLYVAFQPIVDLASGQVVGAEALARFEDPGGGAIPTERGFLDAHAVGLGAELELAVIALALACRERLPAGRYLALNVSPATLDHPRLVEELRREAGRPLVIELTEHQAVEDYLALGEQLDRLRGLGIRVAVDDVGSGFSSFRHVTRVNPDILKLDRTLVSGIDDDPVRQSLASAIVSFARCRRRRRVGGDRVRERAVLPEGPRGRLRAGLPPGAAEPRGDRDAPPGAVCRSLTRLCGSRCWMTIRTSRCAARTGAGWTSPPSTITSTTTTR